LSGNRVYSIYKFCRTSWQPDLKSGDNLINVENLMQ
jgi:hypothetical protein